MSPFTAATQKEKRVFTNGHDDISDVFSTNLFASSRCSDFNSSRLKATPVARPSCDVLSHRHTALPFVGLHPPADRAPRRPKKRGDMERRSFTWVYLQHIVPHPADTVAHNTCAAPCVVSCELSAVHIATTGMRYVSPSF